MRQRFDAAIIRGHLTTEEVETATYLREKNATAECQVILKSLERGVKILIRYFVKLIGF